MTVGKLLQTLTWIEAERYLTPDRVVIVPLGADAKEHGPHLRLENDRILADCLRDRVLEKLDVIAAPTVGYHFYPAFVEYPGSTTLRLETARDLIVDIVHSFSRHGCQKFYVLNTGVSTLSPLRLADEALSDADLLFRYTDILRLLGPVEEQHAEQEGGTHADEVETSMMLHIAPESVNMNLAVKDYHPRSERGLSRCPDTDQTFSASGIYGDATLANADKGAVFFETLAAGVIADVEALSAIPLGH